MRSFYRKFYEGLQLSGVRQAGEIPIRFHLGNAGYDMMRARSSWISRRKPIIEFSVLETNAKAAALVGDRMRITHRRYLLFWRDRDCRCALLESGGGFRAIHRHARPCADRWRETEGGWGFNFGNDWG